MSEYNFDDNEPSYHELDKQRKEAEAAKKSLLTQPAEMPAFRQQAGQPNIKGGGNSSTGNTANETVAPPVQSAQEVQEIQDAVIPEAPGSSAKAESSSALVDAAAKPAPIDIAAETVKAIKKEPARSAAPKTKSKEDYLKQEYVKSVPSGVMQAMRSLFPCKLNASDLISAFVYIHTNGGCRISEKAKLAVDLYTGDKESLDIANELAGIKNSLKKLSAANSAIELGTAFMIHDRLFSTTRAVKPKEQNLRDTGTLDMLDNMRKSGRNQSALDADIIGREIHASKSKTDYKP